MPTLEIRPAQPEDREAVLAFCQQTWEQTGSPLRRYV